MGTVLGIARDVVRRDRAQRIISDEIIQFLRNIEAVFLGSAGGRKNLQLRLGSRPKVGGNWVEKETALSYLEAG
jgi:hypothetical protein